LGPVGTPGKGPPPETKGSDIPPRGVGKKKGGAQKKFGAKKHAFPQKGRGRAPLPKENRGGEHTPGGPGVKGIKNRGKKMCGGPNPY